MLESRSIIASENCYHLFLLGCESLAHHFFLRNLNENSAKIKFFIKIFVCFKGTCTSLESKEKTFVFWIPFFIIGVWLLIDWVNIFYYFKAEC